MSRLQKYQKIALLGCWLVFFTSFFALDHFENKTLPSLILVASLAGLIFFFVVGAIEISQRPKDELLTKQAQSFLRGDWFRRKR